MIGLLTVLALIAGAIGSFLGANACDPGTAQTSLNALGGALVGLALPSLPAFLQAAKDTRDFQKGHATPTLLMTVSFVSLAMLAGAVLVPSCHSVKPDQLWQATVDCAKVNPESSKALGAVEDCVAGVVMSNASACVKGLIVGMKYEDPVVEAKVKIRWAVEEVACVSAWIAQKNNMAVQLAPMDTDMGSLRAKMKARDEAARFLVENQIRIRNSYVGP
jgi:hypothetical protein